MNPLNITKSPPPPAGDVLAKRKRGRPRKDEASIQQENTHVTPKPVINLVGKAVTGVVQSVFEAGYFLNVKVDDSDTMLRGVVFIPGRVKTITPENDLAPNVKMHGKEEINNNQTDQSYDVTTSSGVENSDPTRALSLLAEVSNGQMKEKDGVIEEAETRLVEFFPRPETMLTTAQVLKPVKAEKEREQQILPSETRGFDLMAEKPVCPGEKVPEELQLELGKKTIILSGDNSNNNMETTTDTDPKSSVSKSGFIANLFEGVDKKSDCDMEEIKAEETTSSAQ